MMARHGVRFRVRNIPAHDRAAVIQATGGRAHTVPCILDGPKAVADFTDFGQEVARHLDAKYKLGLFPRNREGIQAILARYIENELEGVGFKINDSYLIPSRPLVERTMLIRHKERKFGRGCVALWTTQRPRLIAEFAGLLGPLDNMLASSPFLVGDKPLFVDYDLYGVLGNYLFNGITRLPPLKHLRHWHAAMQQGSQRG